MRAKVWKEATKRCNWKKNICALIMSVKRRENDFKYSRRELIEERELFKKGKKSYQQMINKEEKISAVSAQSKYA